MSEKFTPSHQACLKTTAQTVFFFALLVFSPYMPITGQSAISPFLIRASVFIFACVFTGIGLANSILTFRSFLTFNESTIESCRWKRKFISTSSIKKIQWLIQSTSRHIIIEVTNDKIVIDIDNFKPEDAQRIIDKVNNCTTPTVQEGWEVFKSYPSTPTRRLSHISLKKWNIIMGIGTILALINAFCWFFFRDDTSHFGPVVAAPFLWILGYFVRVRLK